MGHGRLVRVVNAGFKSSALTIGNCDIHMPEDKKELFQGMKKAPPNEPMLTAAGDAKLAPPPEPKKSTEAKSRS